MFTNSIAQNRNIFQQIREKTSFPSTIKAFLPGIEIPRNRKISCLFHRDKTPSFHIYENGFFCFSCGEAGDQVDFVAKLYNLRPLDAARLICEKFGLPMHSGPLTRGDRLRLARAKASREREKRLQEAFKRWERETTWTVRRFTEAIRSVFEIKGVDIGPEVLPFIHDLPMLEFWADVLNGGTDEEKLELFRNAEFRRWFN